MMKENILHGCLTLAVGTMTLFISSCASAPITDTILSNDKVLTVADNVDPAKYNLALAEAIQNADKIVIKEHSHKVDFFGTAAGIDNPPTYSYARKELTPGEKILFLEKVKGLKGVAISESTSCLFVPHHTIDFYEQGQLKSSMRVCYKCNDIKWNGTKYKTSKDVFDAISPAISRAGMQTHRAWDVMAKQRYEEENKPKPPEPGPGPGLGPDLKPVGPPTAKWVPGKKGKMVINPFTGNEVDVDGIPANLKVRDPNDKDPSHVFRVPEK